MDDIPEHQAVVRRGMAASRWIISLAHGISSYNPLKVPIDSIRNWIPTERNIGQVSKCVPQKEAFDVTEYAAGIEILLIVNLHLYTYTSDCRSPSMRFQPNPWLTLQPYQYHQYPPSFSDFPLYQLWSSIIHVSRHTAVDLVHAKPSLAQTSTSNALCILHAPGKYGRSWVNIECGAKDRLQTVDLKFKVKDCYIKWIDRYLSRMLIM